MQFPAGFLWGSATAAHQIEGGNWNNDWWAWEHQPGSPCVAPSGDACDHYHRFRDDIALVASLGQRVFRFSVEWSRVEPEDGEFSAAALARYGRVLDGCEQHNLIPMVTLHHFTTPRWLAARGGWAAPEAPARFGRFAGRVMAALGARIPYVCTINEPNIVAVFGYLAGMFPPGARDPERYAAARANLLAGHAAALAAVKSGPGAAQVGLTVAMQEFTPVPGGRRSAAGFARLFGAVIPNTADGALALAEAGRSAWHGPYLDAVRDDGSDFVGVQTYTRVRVGDDGVMDPEPDAELTQMGYEFWPAALAACVREAAARTGKPVIVTENGIGTDDDGRRIAYTDAALRGLHQAIADGADVRGYIHWSTMDNFEWALGYGPKFGLVAVEPNTLERKPKPSALWYGDVCRRNGLDA